MDDDIRQTVLGIYDTVADQSIWPSVLDRVAERLDARGCLIFELEEHALSAPLTSSWYRASALRDYMDTHRESELADHRIFLDRSLAHDSVDIIPDSVLYDDLSEFRSRANVRHVMQFGILHRAAALLNKDNPNVSRFSVQFRSDRDGITAEESAYLNRLLPHIAKALELGRPAQQLALEHRGLLAAMDRLSIGMCLLDPNGRMVQTNGEFRRQLATYRVFQTTPNGVLQLSAGDDHKRFETLRADALNHGRFGARPRKEAVSTDAGTFLCIEVSPLDRSEEIGSAPFGGCILYSTDTSLPVRCQTLPVKQAYGLTDAELSLAEAIAEGLTNVQIAERRDRSVATINVQVKSILSKTGCATRTQFVRLLMNFGMDYLTQPGE